MLKPDHERISCQCDWKDHMAVLNSIQEAAHLQTFTDKHHNELCDLPLLHRLCAWAVCSGRVHTVTAHAG